MTQKYYVERLFLIYCDAMDKMRLIHDKPWLLQEDGDPSYGIRKEGLAQVFKKDHDIQNLEHPAQNPYLNSIEGIWNIIKKILRRRIFDLEEMKQGIQKE